MPWYQGVLDMTEDKPWLWGVFVVAALVPILLIFYCCMGSSKVSTTGLKLIGVQLNW